MVVQRGFDRTDPISRAKTRSAVTTDIETTDAPETSATRYSRVSGDEFRGKLNVGGGDWLHVTLTGANTYTFGAAGIGAVKAGVTDSQLVLHAADS